MPAHGIWRTAGHSGQLVASYSLAAERTDSPYDIAPRGEEIPQDRVRQDARTKPLSEHKHSGTRRRYGHLI